jgi:ferredoxin/flavodoxin
MDIRKVYSVYFSPTGTTEKTVIAVADGTGISNEKYDLTTREVRRTFKHSFGKDELVVAGLPVYHGRLPKNIDDFFSGLKGNSTSAIAVIVFGNREYEDALIELKMRLEGNGFEVIAGAAFIGEHTFSKNIATGRPDEKDIAIAAGFGRDTAASIARNVSGTLTVKGNYPFVAKGYDPTHPELYPSYPNVTTTEECTHCGLCAENCPWGAIDIDDPTVIIYSKCMRCFRCIKNCPSSAKKVIDAKFLDMLPRFEMRLNARRCEPELFLPQ